MRGKGESPFEPGPDQSATETLRPVERHSLCLIGVVPQKVTQLGELFTQSDKQALYEVLMQEAGLPWAKAFEDCWQQSEQEARKRGMFDLAWRRRALEDDPVVNAPDFTGFDVLMTLAWEVAPELAELLSFIDGNNTGNPRRGQGPDWWQVWHEANASPTAGWLDEKEAARVHHLWSDFANSEVEEACLTIMGTPYTHQGCWGLMQDLGGFFGQCSSERRSVVAEVDL